MFLSSGGSCWLFKKQYKKKLKIIAKEEKMRQKASAR